jgi:hypothetical protein
MTTITTAIATTAIIRHVNLSNRSVFVSFSEAQQREHCAFFV